MASLFMLEDTMEEKILILEKEIKKLQEDHVKPQDIDDLRSIIGYIPECHCNCENCENYS